MAQIHRHRFTKTFSGNEKNPNRSHSQIGHYRRQNPHFKRKKIRPIEVRCHTSMVLQRNRYPQLFPDTPADGNMALLYPSNDAVPLDTLATKPRHLIVLDGTWYQAKGLYLSNKWLHSLPKVTIANSDDAVAQRPSEFVIRTQPNKRCISTVEAVGRALLQLEDVDEFGVDTYERLMLPLRYLCKVQLDCGAVPHDPKSNE